MSKDKIDFDTFAKEIEKSSQNEFERIMNLRHYSIDLARDHSNFVAMLKGFQIIIEMLNSQTDADRIATTHEEKL